VNLCDNCLRELDGKRLVLGDAQHRAVWTLSFADIDQEHQLVACSRECAQVLTPDLKVPRLFYPAAGRVS